MTTTIAREIGDNRSVEQEQGIRLNLGCGDDILPGYVNHDFAQHRPEVEVTHDLQVLPWPWATDSTEEIRMADVLEHLTEVVPTLDECWRILQPGRKLYLRVPHYQHENAWLDPTHRRPFHLNSFDYFDPDTYWGAKCGFYTQRKWRVAHKEICDGNVVVIMRPRKDVKTGPETWRPYTWAERLSRATEEIAALIPVGQTLILVDQDEWGTDGVVAGRRAIPFLERDGKYWGAPPDDDIAIREFEQLRRAGASFIVIAWSAFWWLDHYADLYRHLRSNFRCALDNDRLVIFDLRPGVLLSLGGRTACAYGA